MTFATHPGNLLRRELKARPLSANRLALDLSVPSGRITDILNGRRSITADTAVRLGRYFGNRAQFWLDLQSQYDISIVERERGTRSQSPCDLWTYHEDRRDRDIGEGMGGNVVEVILFSCR